MAGILSRFADIISANINDLLDKCEDPSKMIDQYLRNALEDFAEVKEETAGVMAEEKRCKRLYDANKANIDKYTNLAKKALLAGNEDDARTFLAEKQKYEANNASLEKAYSMAKANAAKMRQLYTKLKGDIESLSARRNNVKATMAVAKTQEKINDAVSAANEMSSSMGAFTRMEEKAQRMLDEANATAELDAHLASGVGDLEAKYSGGGSVAVDDELAALKAEMGLLGDSDNAPETSAPTMTVEEELAALKASMDNTTPEGGAE